MIRELNKDDSARCAAIHMKNAGEWSHNAQMGEAHIRSIYGVFLGAEECFGYGYFKEDKMLCFITATMDYSRTMNRLKRLLGLKKYLQLLRQILARPTEFFDMYESGFVIPKKIKETGIEAYLLTWHNDFELQYVPMAPVIVMNKALRRLSEKGFDFATTQVDALNERPNRFYRS